MTYESLTCDVQAMLQSKCHTILPILNSLESGLSNCFYKVNRKVLHYAN